MNLYTELLAVKQLKDAEAQARVASAQIALEAARDASEQAEVMLAQMRRDETDTGQRLYGDLCHRVVVVRDIDEVKLTMIALRNRVVQQQKAVDDARATQREAERCLADARLAYMHAQRTTSKFVDLSSHIDLEMQREAEHREELEMEDVAIALQQQRDAHAGKLVDSADIEDTVP